MTLRNFCFTINNYNDKDFDNLYTLSYDYIIIGKEVGKEGTPHLQGYMELTKQMRFNTIIKCLENRAHIENRKGTQEQAITYCKKDGNFLEKGKQKEQGARRDLDKTRSLAIEMGMREVTSQCNSQQIQVAKAFLSYNEDPRDWKPEVTWIWGKTGVGKSRLARELTKNDDTYTKSSANKWWDGYDGHNACIIDDFRDSWWELTEMLRLLDRYECIVEVKGGMRQFKPHKIIVTSCRPPEQMYKHSDEEDQLSRRCDKIINL